MFIKDIDLTKEDIRNIIQKHNEEYFEYDSRKNVLLRAVSRCENKYEDTLI